MRPTQPLLLRHALYLTFPALDWWSNKVASVKKDVFVNKCGTQCVSFRSYLTIRLDVTKIVEGAGCCDGM